MTPADGKATAQHLAKAALEKPQCDEIDISTDHKWTLAGMKLKNGTQRSLYQGITKWKLANKPRQQTEIQLAITTYAVQDLTGETPTPDKIWSAIHKCDLSKQIRNYLWKSLHNAYKIGSFWSRIPNMEPCDRCILCGESESMEHITIECPNSNAISIIWNLAKHLWLRREESWPEIQFGTILGCILADFKSEKGKKLHGKNCLFEILVTESVHLIWKLRCEKVIKFEGDPDKFHSPDEIHNRWVAQVNR
ncbi:hypothetical protein L208DRAFT_1530539 [Tricholoma matsutake]|nr:hypothetical protein L208DRAFT_1530539 [Tricholoma matsutake 945]